MNSSKYTPVIGLEIHAEQKTKSKMFCGCKNDPFGADKPNIYTCPVCLGMPGALPVANKKAIDWTIKLGLALDCKINMFSKFDRKNYFYADLAKGYQISQYDIPFCITGKIETSQGTVRIHRIHLEEDTGKLLHKELNGKKVSLVDFNRGGVPLIEIVTEPDIKTASQAKEYGKKLRQLIRWLEIGDCDMEQGGMRLEANISLKKADAPVDELPNYKVEVKNINSFKFLEQAIEYEIDRQARLLDKGKTPVQETRGFNSSNGKTFSQRSKEAAEDYRYFPDPDLPPLRFTKAQIEAIRKEIPTLPIEKSKQFAKDFSLEKGLVEAMVTSKKKANWFEAVLKQAKKDKVDANKLAKAIINKKFKYKIGDDAKAVMASYGKSVQTDTIDSSQLEAIAQKMLDANPDAVAKYKAGKTQIIGFLMGQVMREAKKKINPKLVKDTLDKLLAS
jgi:aspartyl-tRNA(Asn)/glutamyl-tRNA(Gln) amidotransferase subunit B